jgi:transcriptional regulator with XRE-family HTH domain
MTFIERLMKVLTEKGISQYKLCKDLEIGQSTISSWKKGKMPTADKIITIVQYLEVSADWLLGLDKEQQDLTEEERKLLAAFRIADARGKKNILRTAQAEADQAADAPDPEEVDQGKLYTSKIG